MAKSDFKFHTSLRVRWMECDAQGIVYNGKYMDYMEIGQSEYFRNLGFSIYRIAERGYFDVATVRALIEYKAPARVDDEIDIFVRVSRIGNTSITLEMEIYPDDSDVLLTTMEGVYVGFVAESGATRPVPGAIRELVETFESTGGVLPLERFPELAAAARIRGQEA